MANTDLNLGSDATAANNLKLRADGAGGGSICNGAGTELVKVPAGGAPCFRAYASGTTSITSSGNKVSLAAEVFDTNAAFDPVTNYRFTPQVAGYYHIIGGVNFATGTYSVQAMIYKNGTLSGTGSLGVAQLSLVSDVVFLNGSTDYVELYGYSATTQNASASTGTFMSGFLVKAT